MPFQLRLNPMEGLTMKYYQIVKEETYHTAPIGIGHNSIVVLPGPTFGLASVAIVDESGNVTAWLMEDETLETSMAYAKGRSYPQDWDTDTHFDGCPWCGRTCPDMFAPLGCYNRDPQCQE